MPVTENGEAMSSVHLSESTMSGVAWYAIYTKPRWEKKVWQTLQTKDVHTYCPIQRVQRQWSDRKKIVFEPAIKSYLFVRIATADMVRVLETPGVLYFVKTLGKPARIRTTDMEAIQRFFQDVELFRENERLGLDAIKPFDTVLINQGLFMNERGVLVEWVGKRARVLIKRLNWELSVLFDRNSFLKA